MDKFYIKFQKMEVRIPDFGYVLRKNSIPLDLSW